MKDLREADIESPPGDHLGDYVAEYGDPYPATQDAWARSTVDEPADTTTTSRDAIDAVGEYAASPMKTGTMVRQVIPNDWAPGSMGLADGAQGGNLVEYDPYRTSIRVFNHSTGPVYVSPQTSRLPGPGSLMIPGRNTDNSVNSVEIRSTGPVFYFTTAGFVAGVEPVHLQWLVERYG